jgi:uncharacterized protein YegL
MKLSVNLFAGSMLAGAALLGYAGNAHAQDLHDQNIFVLDMSGSMLGMSTNSKTKFAVLKERANAALDKIAARTGRTQHFEIRTFANTGSQVIRPFGEGSAAAMKMFINDLPDPDGTTPLAGAACAAIDSQLQYENELFNQGAMDLSEKYLYLITDGLENSTPAAGSETADCNEQCTRCQGTEITEAQLTGLANGTVLPESLSEDTWARKVFNTARTGDPTNSNTPLINTIVNIDVLFDFIPSGMSLLDVAVPEAPASGGSSPFLTSAYTSQISAGWEAYLKKLAERTGGKYKAYKPNAAGPALVVSGSLIGDVNGDGCVGKVDYQKMHQTDTWLKRTSPDKPHIYASDLDYDTWVRASDHQLLMMNYGRGTCKPADL